METAMKQLKEKLLIVAADPETPKDYILACENIAKDIDAQMMDIEKQQIIDAYVTGSNFYVLVPGVKNNAVKYYSDTYNAS